MPYAWNETRHRLPPARGDHVGKHAGTTGAPNRLWRANGEWLVPDIDTGLSPVERYHYRPQADAPHALLDEAAWGAHWVERRAMSAAEAVGYALAEEVALTSERPPAGGQTDEPRTDHITSWEREGVTALVVQGMSNRQIASELYLSERMVENHLSEILRKLRLAARAEIVVLTIERRLLAPDPDRFLPSKRPERPIHSI